MVSSVLQSTNDLSTPATSSGDFDLTRGVLVINENDPSYKSTVSNEDLINAINEVNSTIKLILYRLNSLELNSSKFPEDETLLKGLLPLSTVDGLLQFDTSLKNEDTAKELVSKLKSKILLICKFFGQIANFEFKL